MIGERLAAAGAEGIAENFGRWLDFIGWRPGQVIELQALKVPNGRFELTRFAHAETRDAIVRLLSEAERFGAQGVFTIANWVDPAVSARKGVNRWFDAMKGESTSDRDIRARAVLFIDVDAKRPAGISATDEEVALAEQVAEEVYTELATILGSEHALGVGHSGNGRAVFVALERIEESPAVAAQVKAILAALDARFSNDRVHIDASVADAKRLVPAWGTTKRKGAANVADRPHRRTAFVCSDRVVRLRGLEVLAAKLRAKPSPRTRAQATPPAREPARNRFRTANDLPVENVAEWLGLVEGGEVRCPGCGSSGSSVAFVNNGLKCLHQRCASEGAPRNPGFRTPVDLVCKVRDLAPAEAVRELANQFGVEIGPDPQDARYERVERAAIISDSAPPAREPPRSRFEWIGTSAIFDPLPETKWLVPGVQLCPGRPSMCAGYGSSGKTIAGQAMLLALAAGRPVWGHFDVPRAMKVRHIDHEQGRHATLKRYQRLARGIGLTPDDLGARLEVALFPKVYLNSSDAEKEYVAACEGVDLVLIDALKGATPGEDENDSKIRSCIDVLTRVSERTGCAFWVLHHAGKPKDGHADSRTVPRGSSAIFDAAGSLFVMSGEKGAPKLMSQQKVPAEAESGEVEDFLLRIEDVGVDVDPNRGVRVVHEAAEARAPTAPKALVEDTVERVRAFLRTNTDVPGKEVLREMMGIKQSRLQAALRILEDRGELFNAGTARAPKLRLRASLANS